MGPLPLDLSRIRATFAAASLGMQNLTGSADLAVQHGFHYGTDSLRQVYRGLKPLFDDNQLGPLERIHRLRGLAGDTTRAEDRHAMQRLILEVDVTARARGVDRNVAMYVEHFDGPC